MSVSNISTTARSSASAASAATASTGAMAGSKDEFLKLFMAQLEHQDPLNPQDGADMVSQLAQFSSVEQATQTNAQLADLATATAANQSASLSGLVGRNCKASPADFMTDGKGAAPPLQLASSSAMTGASVIISDDAGNEIRRITIPEGKTSATVQWDGKSNAGNAVPAGSYHMSIDAGKSNAVIDAQWQGRIDAVELTSSGTKLRMGSILMSPATIQTIGNTASSTSSAAPSAT